MLFVENPVECSWERKTGNFPEVLMLVVCLDCLDAGVYILAIELQVFFRIESNFFQMGAILRKWLCSAEYEANGLL